MGSEEERQWPAARVGVGLDTKDWLGDGWHSAIHHVGLGGANSIVAVSKRST